MLLKKGTVSLINTGPYKFKDGDIDWDQVLVGDRAYALLMIRVATYGPEYAFDVSCDVCGESIKWSVNLTDLPIQKYSDETLNAYAAGNKLLARIDNTRVVFRLIDGKRESHAQKGLRHAKNPLVIALGQRIVEVEGTSDKMGWIRNLPMMKALELIEVLDQQDGGIETEIDVVCDSCSAEIPVNLPFDRREFWMPKVKKKKTVL
jgi:hypothetical protein